MKKNKHIMVAMIVAPILAIISYFATDYAVSDQPIAAAEGESYALLARPNCRYESGECTLKNGDIELQLRIEFEQDSGRVLMAKSNQPLTGIRVALVNGEEAQEAVALERTASDGTIWMMPLSLHSQESNGLRVAFESSGRVFYASTDTAFFDYDTIFPRGEW